MCEREKKKSDIRGRRGGRGSRIRRGHKKVVDVPHSSMIPLNVVLFINGWPSCVDFYYYYSRTGLFCRTLYLH